MLALSEVSAGYGSVRAVSDVSIAVGEGEAVGLLGANGAGKSTTLRAISGLVRKTSGAITFLGTNITSLPSQSIASRCLKKTWATTGWPNRFTRRR